MTFGPIDTIFTRGAVILLIGSACALLRLGFTGLKRLPRKLQLQERMLMDNKNDRWWANRWGLDMFEPSSIEVLRCAEELLPGHRLFGASCLDASGSER